MPIPNLPARVNSRSLKPAGAGRQDAIGDLDLGLFRVEDLQMAEAGLSAVSNAADMAAGAASTQHSVAPPI